MPRGIWWFERLRCSIEALGICVYRDTRYGPTYSIIMAHAYGSLHSNTVFYSRQNHPSAISITFSRFRIRRPKFAKRWLPKMDNTHISEVKFYSTQFKLWCKVAPCGIHPAEAGHPTTQLWTNMKVDAILFKNEKECCSRSEEGINKDEIFMNSNCSYYALLMFPVAVMRVPMGVFAFGMPSSRGGHM